jgi:hypothetical protein
MIGKKQGRTATRMNIPSPPFSIAFLKLASLATVVLLAIATLVGWNYFGTDILLNAASAGLSWCF